jgi:hypothetical protein
MTEHLTPVALEQLPSSELIPVLPQLISSLDTEYPPTASQLQLICILRERAAEQEIADTTSNILIISNPLTTPAHVSAARVIIWSILSELPSDVLHTHYQRALTDFATPQSVGSRADTVDAPQQPQAPHLRDTALLLARFASSSFEIWTPTSKYDTAAIRSLNERVKSPTEMTAYVPELLAWLADQNWPIYNGCVKQLARFPEVCVEPIRKLIERERGDGAWIANVLRFTQEQVPIEQWTSLEYVLRVLKTEPKGDETDCEVEIVAEDMLAKLDAQGLK